MAITQEPKARNAFLTDSGIMLVTAALSNDYNRVKEELARIENLNLSEPEPNRTCFSRKSAKARKMILSASWPMDIDSGLKTHPCQEIQNPSLRPLRSLRFFENPDHFAQNFQGKGLTNGKEPPAQH